MKKENKLHYKKQRRYFDKDLRVYKDYSWNINAWRQSYLRRIRESLLDKNYKGKTLIDIGAGSGYVSVEMAKLGLKVFAVDISEKALANIERYKKLFGLKNLKVVKAFAEKLPILSASADYIVVNAILEHIPNERKAVNDWKRVLKNGGKIFITSPIKYRYIWPFFWPVYFLHDRILGHLRRYDLISLENLFQLKVRKVYYTGHLLKTLWVLFSRTFSGNIQKTFSADKYFEVIDERHENKRYGTTNIIVVFQK